MAYADDLTEDYYTLAEIRLIAGPECAVEYGWDESERLQRIAGIIDSKRPELRPTPLLTPEEADLIIGAIPLQALPDSAKD